MTNLNLHLFGLAILFSSSLTALPPPPQDKLQDSMVKLEEAFTNAQLAAGYLEGMVWNLKIVLATAREQTADPARHEKALEALAKQTKRTLTVLYAYDTAISSLNAAGRNVAVACLNRLPSRDDPDLVKKLPEAERETKAAVARLNDIRKIVALPKSSKQIIEESINEVVQSQGEITVELKP